MSKRAHLLPLLHKAMASLWLLAAPVLLCARLTAQEYSLRNYAIADGLGNLSIQKIYQDSTGFIWVSTENGVFRFDGSRFESFGPPEGLPAAGGVAFGDAPDGALLVGANIGLFRLAGNHFERVAAPFKTVNWTEGIASDGHGTTYVATESGLFTLKGKRGQAGYEIARMYPAQGAPAEAVYSVFLDSDTVWLGCGGELCALQSGEVKTLGEESGVSGEPITGIVKDGEGNLWIRVRNAGVFERRAGEKRFRWPDTPIAGSLLTGSPALDRDGRILLGGPKGLLIEEAKGWRLIDRHTGLRGGVFAAFEDRQHTLWIGTGGRGLTAWRGYREWENYTTDSGVPDDNVYEMLPQADGSIWAATEAGLSRGEPEKFRMRWTAIAALYGIPVHSLQMDGSGHLWMGTAEKGVGRLDAATGAVTWFGEEQGLAGKLALTIRFDSNHQLWATTEAGLFVAKAPYKRFSRVTELPASWFWTVAIGGDGTIWAGGADGLFALHGEHWQHWTRADGLSNQAVTAIGVGADGAAWVGYQHGGGIDRVHLEADGAGAERGVIERGVQRPGTNGLVYFLDFDREGRLWAGTERGVDMWDGAHWSHYGTEDGLVWDDCDLGGFAAGPGGTLWFGTAGGISRFTPRPAAAAGTARVVFTELFIGSRDVFNAHDPSFASGSGALTAEFAAPDAAQGGTLTFRYRLDGASSQWTETTERQLEFAELAPGKYRLEVEVRDRLGRWSEKEAEFDFSIRRPWYLSGWFLAMLILVPVGGASAASRVRSASARRREERLQRVVEEKTSDLRKANEELLRLTMLDPLTGLANRRRFDQALAQECERLSRSDAPISLIFLDVDHFKALNDSSGHQKGDEYLVILGKELMRAARRRIDLAARIGGEEFALILPATEMGEAAKIAETIRREVERLKLLHLASPTAAILTVSAGVATGTATHYATPEELVAAADQALYQAKKLGRNRVELAR